MTSYLPFTQSNPLRTKRKMSGPVGSWTPLDTNDPVLWPEIDDINGDAGAGGRSLSHWCESVDYREVAGFALFTLFILADVGLGVMVWVTFFKFVIDPDQHHSRATWGGIWLLLAGTFSYVRRLVRSRVDAHLRGMMDHTEIFVAMSIAMIVSVNIAFYLHEPTTTPLRDLGFMLIPEQSLHSKWRPVSDVLTAVVPIMFLLQTSATARPKRCRIVSSFFRTATVCYFLRMLTVSVTSLPGPAPHCRAGSPDYHPPTTWIDIVTSVGPIYGKYNSCGDLIFSGHMAYTNSAVLLYLRTFDRSFTNPTFSKIRWACGVTYLTMLAVLCIAGRKHYTVDVVLGFIISTMVFFLFEHSWVPLCFQVPHGLLPLGDMPRVYSSQLRKRFSMDVTDELLNELDDGEGDGESRRLLKANASTYNQVQLVC
uniref:Sphingomyelin synthase-like domain-containing protein n=1 Tax=Peronospora matthiolae TaxID=2874970 RepID=A0AAV1UAX3_9STRA